MLLLILPPWRHRCHPQKARTILEPRRVGEHQGMIRRQPFWPGSDLRETAQEKASTPCRARRRPSPVVWPRSGPMNASGSKAICSSIGWASTTPAPPSAEWARNSSAACRGVSTRAVECAGRWNGRRTRKLIGPVTDDRYAVSFEHFQSFGNVEDRLGPGTDDGHRGARQLGKVGGNVPRVIGIAVGTADAAGRE